MTRDYSKLEKYLKEIGLSEDDRKEYIDNERREDAAIDACKCPVCGGELQKKLDPRQAGDSGGHGQWFNYRCSSCPFMMDRAEGAN